MLTACMSLLSSSCITFITNLCRYNNHHQLKKQPYYYLHFTFTKDKSSNFSDTITTLKCVSEPECIMNIITQEKEIVHTFRYIMHVAFINDVYVCWLNRNIHYDIPYHSHPSYIQGSFKFRFNGVVHRIFL